MYIEQGGAGPDLLVMLHGLGATAAGSTVMEKNLDRLTVFAALIFTMSTFGLALTID